MPYNYQPYPYTRPPGLAVPEPRHQVVIVGAGPVGLAMALDLSLHGIASVVLDDNNVVSMGSRAICWSRRSLQLFQRLGIGDKVSAKAVSWHRGRIFHGRTELFETDLHQESLQPAFPNHQPQPVFANLQQYHVEEFLIAQARESDLVDLRFRNRVVAFDQTDDTAHVTIDTPDGQYGLKADYVIACDGARSPIRSRLKLEFEGRQLNERFVIADIAIQGPAPDDRVFWFDPPFHDGPTALLHKQPDGLWRVDLQLAEGADGGAAVKPDQLRPRIAAMLGHDDFELDWVSLYTFQCRRLAQMIHRRLIFAGDAAHVVSPFGARGGNGGLLDVDNLGWKLAAVIRGQANPDLLVSYDRERGGAASEDLESATWTARFMSPASDAEALFRGAVLALAAKAPFARALVNSGRMRIAPHFPTTGPDDSRLPYEVRPGSVAPDAPQGNGWLMEQLGTEPTILTLGCKAPDIGVQAVEAELNATTRARYLGEAPQAIYLLRPDHVIAARWVQAEPETIHAALAALWEGRP